MRSTNVEYFKVRNARIQDTNKKNVNCGFFLQHVYKVMYMCVPIFFQFFFMRSN